MPQEVEIDISQMVYISTTRNTGLANIMFAMQRGFHVSMLQLEVGWLPIFSWSDRQRDCEDVVHMVEDSERDQYRSR